MKFILHIYSVRARWAGHVIFIEEMRNTYIILVRKPEGRDHLQDLDIDGRIISRHILRKLCVRVQTTFICLRTRPSVSLL
jgi:hypothetical protein